MTQEDVKKMGGGLKRWMLEASLRKMNSEGNSSNFWTFKIQNAPLPGEWGKSLPVNVQSRQLTLCLIITLWFSKRGKLALEL